MKTEKLITLETIKSYDPCTSGWKNLLRHYPEWEGTLLEFMELDSIPDDDKVWLFSRENIVDESVQREFALIVAEATTQYTNRQEIHDYMTLIHLIYVSGYTEMLDSAAYSTARYDAYSSAYSAVDNAAYSAARSTAYSAALSAAYSAVDYAVYSAARKDQVDIIKNLLEEL